MPRILYQPLSLHKYRVSPAAVYCFIVLCVSRAAGNISGYSLSWREKERLVISSLPPILLSGDYLVTIEVKNSATYLRAYTNWRYQVHTMFRTSYVSHKYFMS